MFQARQTRWYRNVFLFAFLAAQAFTPAQAGYILLDESFTSNSASSGWIIGGNASLTGGRTDPNGSGWLQLTPNSQYQAGYAIWTNSISSAYGISIDFDYNMWGGGGAPADGLAVAIIDPSARPTQPGAIGGALGYAQNWAASPKAGIMGGILGIALDEWGNFSYNAGEGRPGSTNVQTQSTVAIRGPGNGTDAWSITAPSGAQNYPNYNLLTESAALPAGVLSDGNSATRPATNNHALINFDMSDITNGNAYVSVTLWDAGTKYTPILNYNVGPALIDYYGVGNVPTNFDLALTAGTGYLTDTHEIRNLVIDPPILPGAPGGAVPEPGVAALLGVGGALLWLVRRRGT